jgi:endonuclease YncB( thermonuclease family)
MRQLHTFTLLILFFTITTYFILIPTTHAIQTDLTGQVSYVHDGDTFDINSGNTAIRLADIDAPEYGEAGYDQAKWYLYNLVYGKTVYLDQSTLNGLSFDRLVCIVYIDYDSSNYLNVNKKMIASGYASQIDYSNDFNPATWTMLVPKSSLPPPFSYTLSIRTPIGEGSTNPMVGSYTYSEVTSLRVVATPSTGWALDHWELDGVNVGNINPYDITMNTDYQLKAVFSQSQTSSRMVIIDQFIVDDDRVDVGTIQSVTLHARWDNGSNVSNGILTISESDLGSVALQDARTRIHEEVQTSANTYRINSDGWVSLNTQSDMPTKKTWKVDAVNCSGVTEFTQTAASPSIIWDRVTVMLRVVDDRIDVGSDPSFEWTAFYEYDDVPFIGKVNPARMFPGEDGVGDALFTTVSIEDTAYGLTSFMRNQALVIWDRVMIIRGGVSNQLTKPGIMDTVWFKAVYEYDNSSFAGEAMIYGDVNRLFVNGVPMVWSSSDKAWTHSAKLDDNGKVTFEVTGVEDMQYKLTKFIDVVGPQSITWWEQPFLETPVGIASMVSVCVLIMAGAILVLRKRIS